MEKLIPVAKPWVGEQEVEAFRRVIASGWVTQGPEVEAFEEEFAQYTGAEHACAVSSCTTALHLALLSLGVGPGDEVITVSHSFIATANAIRYCGAVPVFVDIDAHTFNINPNLIENMISKKTRAILCVHQMGMPADMSAILKIARPRNIPVIEDAACAIGSEILWEDRWERIGKPHGEVACFSFHPRKVLTTGDGGMLTTSNPELDKKFRRLRQHGMSVSDLARHSAKKVIFEKYPVLGFNYRMTDIQAAMGRVQLKRLSDHIPRRRKLAANYSTAFEKCDFITTPTEPKFARSNWQSYCVQLSPPKRQSDFMETLLERGISTRRGIMCAHREEAYRGQYRSCYPTQFCDCADQECPSLRVSEMAQKASLILPLYHELSEADQARVIEAVTL